MADGSVLIEAKLKNDNFKKELDGMGDGFSKLKSIATKALTAISFGALVKEGIQYNAQIQKYQTALTTLTGSAQEANNIIEQIKKDAAATPFDVAGLVQANQLLISTGLSADDSRDTILALGNAISATGGGNEELSRMAVNLQQIKNTGKAAAIDIKQFAFAGIDIYGLLADYMGVTKKEASEMEVTWDALNGALIKASQEGGKYFGAMEAQSTTLNGQFSTLKDNFQNMLGNALKPVADILTNKILPKVNEFVSVISEKLETTDWQQFGETLKNILAVIIPLTAAFLAYKAAITISSIISAVTTALNGMTIAQYALNLAMNLNPIGIIISLIAALVTAIIYLWNTNDTFREALISAWEAIKNAFVKVWNAIGKFFTETIPGWIKNAIEWFKNLPYNIGVMIGEMLGHIVQFGIDAWKWATTELPKIIENIINWFKELPGKIWTWLKETVVKLALWALDMKAKANEGIKNVINAILQWFKDLPNNMLNIGRNIVEGLWNGIKNATTWIKNKVKEFARGILDGMKSALGIHSPSKEFAKLGNFSGLGFGEGFTNSLDKVYKKMKSAVDFETQKLNSNLTTNSVIQVQRNSDMQSTLNSIDNNREIQVNSTLELDGKVVANTVNKVNAKQKLQYGIA